MNIIISSVLTVLSLFACRSEKVTPIIGGPCEGCELVFVGMPESMDWSTTINDRTESPLIVEGIVRDSMGRPVEGVIVYAYHTDEGGLYPQAETRHGALRGWARTNDDGRYRFVTNRPGAYPGREDPEHIHMHIIEPGRCTYYISDIVFSDDPRLTDADRDRHLNGRGGPSVCTPSSTPANDVKVERDIVLGKGVPGYSDIDAE